MYFFFDITVVYMKNHLLRNLFFYASAVNVHNCSCAMLCDYETVWSVLVMVSVRITVERTGASRNNTTILLRFHKEEAPPPLPVHIQERRHSNRVGKGIFEIDQNATGLLINIRLLSSPHV